MSLEDRRNSQIEHRALALGLIVEFMPNKAGAVHAKFRGANPNKWFTVYGRKNIESHLELAEMAAVVAHKKNSTTLGDSDGEETKRVREQEL